MLEFMQFELQLFFNQQSAVITHIFYNSVLYMYVYIGSFYYHCLRGKMPTLFISSTFSVETLDVAEKINE